MQLLVEENKELKAHAQYLEKLVDQNEQYSRRNCLVLSGEDLPQADTSESECLKSLLKQKRLLKRL